MSRPSPHTVAVQALRLRAWALRILIAGDAPVPPPQVSAAAWGFFAEMEWCSQPLRSRLCDAGVWDECDEVAQRMLGAAADVELRRIRSAREELALVDGMARRAGWKVMVLKGGVAVAEGVDVHLADVDLLASPPDAAALIAALEATGLEGVEALGEHYFPPRTAEGVAMEVHERIKSVGATDAVLATAEPLPSLPGLLRLPAEEHAWHVLRHAVVSHLDRIGRLRDLLLVRRAMHACSLPERARVEARARLGPAAQSLAAVLAICAGTVPQAGIERLVQRRYCLLARWRRLGVGGRVQVPMRQLLTISTTASASPQTAVRRHLFAPMDAPSVIRTGRWPGIRHPGAIRTLRLIARLGLVCVALSLAWAASLETRIARIPG